ncbi:Hpt domain-containing protein [Actinoplanes sp. NPDC023801]|uniref:Hpt domain-containing protein n=1 Tax=Actinoplanes sp. NPDC023801 TaxID=3154595 RepID=UPI0033EC4D6C
MTAGALPEDRARCLAAGMDDHIAKPVMPQDIVDALERCRGTVAPPRVREQIERRCALLRAAAPTIGDEVLAGLLRRLAAQLPMLLEEIMQAIALDDAQALRHPAHQLKGAAANLGAEDLAGAADRMEQVARAGDLEAAVVVATELRASARDTLAAVDAITAMATSTKA